MYLLTEWEGRTGKYLARGQDVPQCVLTESQIFSRPARPRSVILSYDHFFFNSIFLVERGHARGSIASFRAHFQNANDSRVVIFFLLLRCEYVIAAFRTVHRDNSTHCPIVRFHSFSRKHFVATKLFCIVFAGPYAFLVGP